jgi:hypothetical protein
MAGSLTHPRTYCESQGMGPPVYPFAPKGAPNWEIEAE